jgi:PAS domain S-box-containing protein
METDKQSLSRKWTGLILMACLFVLGTTCLVLMAVEVRNARNMARQNLATTARILAASSAMMPVGDDQKRAQAIISSLQADQGITAAAFYDPQGNIFATYPEGTAAALFPLLSQTASRASSTGPLALFKPIFRGQTRLGTLYLEADGNGIHRQLWIYALILISVLVGAGFVVVALAGIFQKKIYLPILDFAGAVQQISQTRNYSLRAPKTRGYELGSLTEAFNSMLDQMEESNAALQASEEFSRGIFHGCADCIAVLDLDASLVSLNKAGLGLLEIDDFTLFARKDWTVFWPGTSQLELRRAIAEARTGGNGGFQGACVTARGSFKWCEVVVSPIRDKSEKVVRLVAMAHDLSEQRLANEKLVQSRQVAEAASRAKDDFLAALSHELRTPLNVVLLVAGDAAEAQNVTPELKIALELIRQNAELEARLIDDLLDLTSITRGKVTLHKERIDIHSLIQGALTAVRSDLNQKRIMLILQLEAADHVMWGDPVRLQQVMWNLLKNAVKFTPPNGQITIQTARTAVPAILKITFADSGIGLTPEELARIFGAFSQGDHAAKEGAHHFGGLGLGLAIAKNFIELHSGHIQATSKGRDQGATFTVELPLLKNPAHQGGSLPLRMASAHVPPLVAETKTAGLRILLVEDHELTRVALASLLHRRHHSVAAAGSVAEALALAKKQKFDLLISDIGLPDGNGNELMAELKSLYSLKGIALTGYGMEQDISDCLEAGFVTHLTKPVRLQCLEQALTLVASPEGIDRFGPAPLA